MASREAGKEMSRRAVFLDRDGTLIEDVHLLTRREQVRLAPGAPGAVRALREAGFAVVVVSNQTVVSRGMATEGDVQAINQWIRQLLIEAGAGEIEGFYFCPHHPNATLPQYRVECECRKPRPGLLLRAASEMELVLWSSYMIGDRMSDIVAGHRVGCTTLLVETGMHTAPPIESAETESAVTPDVVCADLTEAADWILDHSG